MNARKLVWLFIPCTLQPDADDWRPFRQKNVTRASHLAGNGASGGALGDPLAAGAAAGVKDTAALSADDYDDDTDDECGDDDFGGSRSRASSHISISARSHVNLRQRPDRFGPSFVWLWCCVLKN